MPVSESSGAGRGYESFAPLWTRACRNHPQEVQTVVGAARPLVVTATTLPRDREIRLRLSVECPAEASILDREYTGALPQWVAQPGMVLDGRVQYGSVLGLSTSLIRQVARAAYAAVAAQAVTATLTA